MVGFLGEDQQELVSTRGSAQHNGQGLNVTVTSTEPGKAHDLSAARIWGILRAGAGGSLPEPELTSRVKGKNKPESQKQANRAHARLRGPRERPAEELKNPSQATL
ncbi:hypothetical protein GCM10022419_122130 [Nonomuraea rosea]|uniref:Uncharacterized protein n=1 Tax=Nonomuraea rosea TaxID=638574 RepID=A0ABP6ZPU1_9ACTN